MSKVASYLFAILVNAVMIAQTRKDGSEDRISLFVKVSRAVGQKSNFSGDVWFRCYNTGTKEQTTVSFNHLSERNQRIAEEAIIAFNKAMIEKMVDATPTQLQKVANHVAEKIQD